jgi:predicted MPP superfamily phosphohydrolase
MVEFKTLIPVTEAAESLRRRYVLSFGILVGTTLGLLFWKIRQVLGFLRTSFGILVFLLCLGLIFYACIEPTLLEYSYSEIRIPKSFTPFTAVQLTDLHFQWPYRYVTESSLMKVVEKVNNMAPDYIFVTGDLISRYRTASISNFNTAVISRVLSALRARKGVFGVLGNNDYCALPQILEAFRTSGIRLLRNETVMLAKDISLSGIDSVKSLERAEAAIRSLNVSGDHLKILLAHEPDIGLVAAGSFDLQISGHTHGGQVIVPFGVGPLILPTLGKKFAVGLHIYKDLRIYGSKGIGISPLPKPLVRFNCRPEVSVLRIVPLD